jgi:hypothetical protein
MSNAGKRAIYVDPEVYKKLRELSHVAGVNVGDLIGELCGRRGYGDVSSKRRAAARKGDRTYMGNPCKYGHSGERLTSTGACDMCSKIRGRIVPVEGEDSEWKTIRYKLYEQGEKIYYSPVPCSTCGSHEAHVVRGTCVHCHLSR